MRAAHVGGCGKSRRVVAPSGVLGAASLKFKTK